jgi:hypothetical protein
LARGRADAAARGRVVDGGTAVADICADVDSGPIVERHRRISGILSERSLRAAEHGNNSSSDNGRSAHGRCPTPKYPMLD